MTKKKRKDECLFCTSRTCNHRIVREVAPYYDEIACNAHITDMEKHADKILSSDRLRTHISGYNGLKRGEKFKPID